MKRIILIFLFANICGVYSQTKLTSIPNILESRKQVLELKNAQSFAAILNERKYLTYSKTTDEPPQINVFLNDIQLSSKTLIDQVPFRFNFSTHVSDDGRYISYFVKHQSAERNVGKVYDSVFGKLHLIERPEGSVSHIYVSSKANRITYQLRKYGHAPRLYSADIDGKNAKFVDEALGGPWSPDGKWFLARRISIENVHPRARKRAGTITDQESRQIVEKQRAGIRPLPLFWVFSVDGTPQLELGSFEDFAAGVWSPNAQKLAILNNAGDIYLLDLSLVNNQLSVRSTTLIKKSGPNLYLNSPVWSPDSYEIATIENELNAQGNEIIDSRIVIIGADGSGRLQLPTIEGKLFDEILMWTKDNELYTKEKAINSDKATIIKFDLN